jgi:hypothetical protein
VIELFQLIGSTFQSLIGGGTIAACMHLASAAQASDTKESSMKRAARPVAKPSLSWIAAMQHKPNPSRSRYLETILLKISLLLKKNSCRTPLKQNTKLKD